MHSLMNKLPILAFIASTAMASPMGGSRQYMVEQTCNKDGLDMMQYCDNPGAAPSYADARECCDLVRHGGDQSQIGSRSDSTCIIAGVPFYEPCLTLDKVRAGLETCPAGVTTKDFARLLEDCCDRCRDGSSGNSRQDSVKLGVFTSLSGLSHSNGGGPEDISVTALGNERKLSKGGLKATVNLIGEPQVDGGSQGTSVSDGGSGTAVNTKTRVSVADGKKLPDGKSSATLNGGGVSANNNLKLNTANGNGGPSDAPVGGSARVAVSDGSKEDCSCSS
jgi:hypothetical protein